MLGSGLGVIWVGMIQCKIDKHVDSFLSHCIVKNMKMEVIGARDIDVVVMMEETIRVN